MQIFRLGDQGAEVGDIQQRLTALGAAIDDTRGTFGPSSDAAVRAFQDLRALRVDGLVGPDTWGQLVEAGYLLGDRTLYLRVPVFRGDDVRELQRKLSALGFDAGREDGMFGPRVEAALREFQRNIGHDVDGILGPETLRAVERLRVPAAAASGAMVREQESLRGMRAGIAGLVIAIDPGHGPHDPGDQGPAGTREADVTFAMAAALADELSALGAKPALLRADEENPSVSDRALSANELGAAACVSIHLNKGAPDATGPTCYFFGSATTHSPAGMRLAARILEALEAELGRPGTAERLAGTLLRETRMPAVQIEPLFITNAEEESMLSDPAFAGRIATAVASGIAAFFAPAPI